MKNLERIRAARTFEDQSKTTKRDVTKRPALILANGLSPAAAFAAETNEKGKPKRCGMTGAMDSLACHLGEDTPRKGLPLDPRKLFALPGSKLPASASLSRAVFEERAESR